MIRNNVANDDVWGHLDWRRLLPAFALAPLVPALLISMPSLLDERSFSSFVRLATLYALIGGYLPTILFGLPALFVLRRWLRPRLIWTVLASALVATAPWCLLLLLPGQNDFSSVGGQITVQDGKRTLLGWIEVSKMLGLIFALGAIGGTVFWLIGLCRYDVRPAPASRSM